jgi:hypothetical protein
VDLNERKLTAEYVLLWGEDDREGYASSVDQREASLNAEKLMANKEGQFGDNIN